jgi:hypothetical protein
MKKILLVLGMFSCMQVSAQDPDTTYWKKSFKGALSLNQAAFSDNWKAGGVNSIGFNALLNYKADYLKERHSWNNELDLLFGFINTGEQGYRKSNDRLYFDTKYGYTLGPKWNMFAAFNILTQFTKGYKYEKDSLDREQELLISDLLAPGFFTLSWGFEYVPKPYFKVRLSPFAPRLTVVRNTDLYVNVENNYGVKIGKTTRWEWLAFQLLAEFNKDLSENVNLNFRYLMYANYETFSFEQIDHRLDANLTINFARYFSVNLTAILVYDYDQDSSIQFSQALGIGFIYTFKNYKEEE